ncbi:DUF5677 domain-containing protein [Microvirga terrestris]|nr:DUF5677 domain-containing protein [Microvirga terrestris]
MGDMVGRSKKKPAKSGIQATPLDKLQRNKNVIESPFKKIGMMSFSSWVNEVLADALWSVLIAGLLPRDKALATFRVVLTIYKKNHQAFGTTMLVHSQLAQLTPDLFDLLFQPLCQDDETREILSALLVFETLPDRHHWQRVIGTETAPWTEHGERLAAAIAHCFDHQSQEATDCRWLRVMTLLAQEKLFFAEKFEERVQEIIEYPNRGDMRSVRPSIRSIEMTTRNPEFNKEAPPPWSEAFWDECWKNTLCMPFHRDEDIERANYRYLFDQIVEIHNSLTDHFFKTVKTTAVDSRHDGCFGLVFYAIHHLMYAIKASTGQTVASRSLLRTCLEVYITLSFLVAKDDETVWLQYRNYGYGQTKLAYLKNISVTDIPSFLTLELLESIANEDMWIEFQDIKLGAWSDKNLRKMAEEAGVKDVYDRYYDTLSGYVHGNWMAVRHSVFGECLNPLHRFHRIPLPPREFTQDAVPDIVKLLNLCLERLASLYPPFKPRFRLDGGSKGGAGVKVNEERGPSESSSS